VSATAAAFAAVSREAYVRAPDGSQLPQTSAPHVVRRLLDLLDVAPGQRVLEIGTGSGYSTALLAQLVGPDGRVVSVDIDRELIVRAEGLLRADGVSNVEVVHADGARLRAGRFDRLVAWASVPAVPSAWPEQITPGGLMVVPLRDPGSRVVALRVGEPDAAPVEEAVVAGSFVPLTPEPFRPWLSGSVDLPSQE
jgi:protein-L-isoaspartate(D-aspartate) O-methyltransferase